MKQKSSRQIPEDVKELLELAQSTRLYILEKKGPTSINYCDDKGNKFQVVLSEVMQCSCKKGPKHCIHTIHALLKVFQVDPKSPILWTNNYSQYDIYNILNGQYKAKEEKERPDKPARPPKPERPLPKPHEPQAIEFTQDDLCPICQESLLCNEALVQCKRQCNNYFHAQCMKVWVQQKQSAGKKEIACPMCRVDWGETALTEIRLEERTFEMSRKCHKRTCQSCKANPICGSIFVCVQCPNYAICWKCFSRHPHAHQAYLTKTVSTEPYSLANGVQLESLTRLFPDSQQGQTEGQLMLIGNTFSKQPKCDLCAAKTRHLKSLPCGHQVDEACMWNIAQNHYVCPADLTPCLPGYFNTLSKQERERAFQSAKEAAPRQTQNSDSDSKSFLPPIPGKKSRRSVGPVARQRSANKKEMVSEGRRMNYKGELE